MSSPAAVEAVLLSTSHVPPPSPPSLTAGPTRDLRERMARFSDTTTHGERRRALDASVASLLTYPFAAQTQRRSEAIVSDAVGQRDLDAIADVGLVVPVETLAHAMGIAETEVASVRLLIAHVARVIGRGEPSDALSDEAVTQLFDRFGPAEEGVAAISLLYQTHDATAGLFASTLLADATGDVRRCSLSGTVRRVSTTSEIVNVDLETPGFEFGLGPHGCPGRSIAERMVAGMTTAIATSALSLDIDAVQYRPDGRAAALPLTAE